VTIPVDVWLRGTNVAATSTIDGPPRLPRAWTDEDVRMVLEGMLRAMKRESRPDALDSPSITLRGLSWIVNPYEGGVVIALEITLGAAVAGPFDVDQQLLESMIARVLAVPDASKEGRVH
jgi:hypothetical protein